MTDSIVVILVCAIAGYWAVSKILSGKKEPQVDATYSRTSRQTAEPTPESQPESEPAAPPRWGNASDPWYRTLEVSPHASMEDIRQAYRRLMSQYHPDKVATLGDELKVVAERKSKAITAAYREAMILRDTRV